MTRIREAGRFALRGMLLVLATVFVTASPTLYTRAATLDEVLAQTEAAVAPASALQGFDQEVEVRLLFRSWRFTNRAERTGDELIVKVGDGAPFFFPESLAGDLLDVREAFDSFDLTLAGEERTGDDTRYVVRAARSSAGGEGAQSGTLWVNPANGFIDKVEAEYGWGVVVVDQTFRLEEPHWVLDRQHAVVRLLGLQVTINLRYSDYTFTGP